MTAKLKTQAQACRIEDLFELIGDDVGKAERVLRMMDEIIARRKRVSRRRNRPARVRY